MSKYIYITLPKNTKKPSSKEAFQRLPVSLLSQFDYGFIRCGHSEIKNEIEVSDHYPAILYEIVSSRHDAQDITINQDITIKSVAFCRDRNYEEDVSPADNETNMVDQHRQLILLYHCVHSAKKNFHYGAKYFHRPIVRGDTSLKANIEKFLDEVRALQGTPDVYPSLIKAVQLVSDVLGLDESGVASRTPRITVKEYNQAVNRLTLQSTQSTILASLGYIMLVIAVIASPYLAMSGALTIPAAVLFAQTSALVSLSIFSKANEDPGRRCFYEMKKMINTPYYDRKNALQQIFHVQPEETLCPTDINDFMLRVR